MFGFWSGAARRRFGWQPYPKNQSGVEPPHSKPRLELLEERITLNAGDLDPTFGSGGKVLTNFIGPIGVSAKVIGLEPDGKIVVAGNGSDRSVLARYNPDGSLDTSFGSGGRVTNQFFAASQGPTDIAIQQDGKIILVGAAPGNPAIQKSSTFAVVRYNLDGSLDAGFGSGGTVSTDFGSGIASATGVVVQSDGKIVVVGNAATGNVAVARYATDGSLDAAFGTAGKVITANLQASNVALQADGKIVVAGGGAVIRYNVDGSLDRFLGAGAFLSFDRLAVGPDGKIVAPGSHTDSDGYGHVSTTVGLQRLNPDGTLDNGFGNNGLVVLNFGINGFVGQSGSGLVVQPDGKIDICGVGSNGNLSVTRLNQDGSSDATFGTAGTATTDFLGYPVNSPATALQPDGKILLAGTYRLSALDQLFVARFNGDGSRDSTFGSGGKVSTGGFVGLVYATANLVAVQADSKIIVAGGFLSTLAMARYNVDGSLDSTFGTGGQLEDPSMPAGYASALVIQADGRILVEASTRLKRYNSDGSADLSFHATIASGGPIAIQPDGKIIVGGPMLQRLNPDGSPDATFGNGGAVAVDFTNTDIALQADGKIILVGPQSSPNTNTFTLLARYNADGSLDTSFGTGGKVNAKGAGARVTVEPDGKILVLGNVLQRFNADGSPDVYFGTAGQIMIYLYPDRFSAAVGPDGSIAVLPASSYQMPANVIELFTPNGGLVVHFGSNGQLPVDPSITTDIVFTPDSKIVVIGNSQGAFAVARYVTAGGSALSANQLYVSKLYLDLLQRPVDSAGLASWTAILDKGGSRAQVVQGIENSQEYHAVEVQTLFHTVLGRTAEPSAVSRWGSFLDQGGTTEQLEAILLGSDEYFSNFGGGTASGFLQAVYQLVLHRPIDASGSQSWGQRALSSGDIRTTVATAILASLESDRLETQSLYGLLLHRPPDPSGFDTFTNLLQQGMPNETAAAIILGSDEYFAQT